MEQGFGEFRPTFGVTHSSLAQAFFLAPDVMEQSGRGENVRLPGHLLADGEDGVQHPQAVVRAM
jgi:hypothetical protein